MRIQFAVVVLPILAGAIAGCWSQPPVSNRHADAAVATVNVTPADHPVPGEKPIPIISATGPYPKASIDETVFDFGTLERKVEGAHTFRIRNEGEAGLEVVIRESETSCQCTVAKVTREDLILPGEDVEIDLTWTGDAPVPRFRQTAQVRTNDPEHPVIELAIVGRIDQPFHLSPETRWYLGDYGEDQTASKSGILFSRTLQEFELPTFVCANPRLTAIWETLDANALEAVEATSGYRLSVFADLTDVIKPFDERVEIRLSSSLTPIASFFIRGGAPKSLK